MEGFSSGDCSSHNLKFYVSNRKFSQVYEPLHATCFWDVPSRVSSCLFQDMQLVVTPDVVSGWRERSRQAPSAETRRLKLVGAICFSVWVLPEL